AEPGPFAITISATPLGRLGSPTGSPARWVIESRGRDGHAPGGTPRTGRRRPGDHALGGRPALDRRLCGFAPLQGRAAGAGADGVAEAASGGAGSSVDGPRHHREADGWLSGQARPLVRTPLAASGAAP